jgi:hypothetical protein
MNISSIYICLTIFFSGSVVAQEIKDAFIFPDSPPYVCIFSTEGKGCTAFQVDTGVYLTAAHCLSDIDWVAKKVKSTPVEKFKLICPTAVDNSSPKHSLNHYKFEYLPVFDYRIHDSYQKLISSGNFPFAGDLVLMISSENQLSSKISKLAKSKDEILQLLKLDKCRTAGYSNGYYAEIPAKTKLDSYDEKSGFITLSGGDSFGDSGGPIICKDSREQDVIIGMTTSILGNVTSIPIQEWLSKAFKQSENESNEKIQTGIDCISKNQNPAIEIQAKMGTSLEAVFRLNHPNH